MRTKQLRHFLNYLEVKYSKLKKKKISVLKTIYCKMLNFFDIKNK